MPIPKLPKYIPDHDDHGSVDDAYSPAKSFRLERMSDKQYWMCVTTDEGVDVHIDIYMDGRRLVARVRQ